jgi:hypothetical protein
LRVQSVEKEIRGLITLAGSDFFACITNTKLEVSSPREEVWCGLDVVGGRLAQEPPNIINIHALSQVAGTISVGFGDPQGTAGMIFKDAYAYAIAEDGSRVDIAHYDPVKKQPVFSEPKCGVCALRGLHRIGSVKCACTTSITAVVRSNVVGNEGWKRGPSLIRRRSLGRGDHAGY